MPAGMSALHSRPPQVRSWAAGVFLGLLCGACGSPSAGGSAAGVNPPPDASSYELSVGGRRILLPKAEWREMQNEATFARNFEATSNPPNRKYQIVTVFMIPMSEDRRIGERLSPTEYLEAFSALKDQVVIQMRRDHGSYWVLSREAFEATAVPGVEFTGVGNLSPADVRRVTDVLRLQIDTTRHLLGERLRAS
jgi:hypothetical protein